MRLIKKLTAEACIFTSLICAFFFLFALVTGYSDPYISAGKFFLIFLFGVIIAFANLIWLLESWNAALKMLIHYVALLATFVVIFVTGGNIIGKGAAAVFSAVIIFTLFYAIGFAVVMLIKRSLRKIESAKPTVSKNRNKKETKTEYTPRFK